MKYFILLLLPWIAGGCAFILARLQWSEPLIYPWPLLAALVVHVIAIAWIGWRRLSLREVAEKMSPSVIAMAVFGASFLLIENTIIRWIVTFLFAGLSVLTLKLYFLLCYDRQRYPVNALSHVNLALVPLIMFFLGWVLDGLAVFIRLPWWIAVCVSAVIVATIYVVTSHPTAERMHRIRWTILGAFIGVQIGVLTQVLPGGMMVQGALAALLVAAPLRVRRYAYQPVPPTRVAWGEACMGVTMFLAILLLSRWA